MEFAVEAQNLLAVSLEGAGGMTTMLKIENLHVRVGGQAGPEGLDPRRSQPAKCTPSWARTARARARSRMCSRAATATRSRPARSTYQGRDLLALAPEERARDGVFLALPVPGGDPGREQRLPAEGGVERQRKHRGLARSRRVRVPGAGAREDEADADGRELPEPRRQRRVLRRREEAQRDPADAGARADARGARRDRLRARHRRAARSSRTASTACARPDRAIVLVTHYQRLLDYIVPDHVHVLAGGRIAQAAATSRSRCELEKRGYDWVRQEAAVA